MQLLSHNLVAELAYLLAGHSVTETHRLREASPYKPVEHVVTHSLVVLSPKVPEAQEPRHCLVVGSLKVEPLQEAAHAFVKKS